MLKYRLALVAAGVFWSLGGLFIKALTTNPVWPCSALAITFYRSFFAALCLAPLCFLPLRTGTPHRKRPVWPRPGDSLAAILFYTLLLALYVRSTQGTTAANAIFLQYTAPLYALALGPLLFREPFHRADLAALAAAMLGIGVLFVGSFHGGERLPLLMGAGSGAMFGLFLLWLRRMRYADPIRVTTVNNAGVALLAGTALVLARPEEAALGPRLLMGETRLAPVVGLLLLMGCVQIALPYVLFSYGLKQVPGVEGSLLALVEPLLNPVWVALFMGEKPTVATMAGGLLIVAGLAARYTLFRSRSPRQLPPST
jgi:drug/metabolite transporter (DMT)-like permease